MNHDVLKGRAPAGKECGMLQLDVPLAGGSMISYTFAKHVRKVLPEDYILDNLELITSPAHTTPPGRGAGLVAFDVRNSQWAFLYPHPLAVDGPLSTSSLHASGVKLTSTLARMFRLGCFVIFGSEGQVIRVDVPSDEPCEHTLQFSAAAGLPRSVEQELGERWQPVADEALRRQGARRWCWLMPGEELCGCALPAFGGFAFQLDSTAAAAMQHEAVLFSVLV